MSKKRFLSIFMVLALCVTMLAGCNGSSADVTTDNSDANAADTVNEGAYKVAFLPTDMSLTFASWLASELTIAFDAYDDMELTVIDSKNELEKQISAMETCVAQGYDYIILLPIEPAAEDDIVQGIIDDGTPVMMINLDDFGVETASSVVANPYDLGTVMAEYAQTLLPENANVVVLLGPSGNTDSSERYRAYNEILFSKNPNITILEEQIGEWKKSLGMDLMESWIQVHGDKIDAVISMNDAMAIGAYEAAKDAGIADGMLFFGVDGLADAAVSIKAGELTATALQDAKIMAEEGARVCNEVLTKSNSQGYEKVQIPATRITDENVQELIQRYQENGMLNQ